jgi:hypothetical protein
LSLHNKSVYQYSKIMTFVQPRWDLVLDSFPSTRHCESPDLIGGEAIPTHKTSLIITILPDLVPLLIWSAAESADPAAKSINIKPQLGQFSATSIIKDRDWLARRIPWDERKPGIWLAALCPHGHNRTRCISI